MTRCQTMKTSISILVSGLLWLCHLQVGHAQSPTIDSLLPLGAQRGSTFGVAIEGQRLDNVTGVLFAQPGIELVDLRANSDEQLKLILRVDKDCRLGQLPFWLVGDTGLSNPRVLEIGLYPLQDEVEPNNETSTATSVVDSGVTLSGMLEGSDVDTYKIDLRAGEQLSATVVAIRLGGAFLDTYLEFIGPDGQSLASMDDTVLTNQDPHLSIIAKQTGPHYLRIRDAAFDGEYMARYLVHLAGSNQPLQVYPAGGRPGEQLQVELLSDSVAKVQAMINLPRSRESVFYYRPLDGPRGTSLLPLPIRISSARNVLEDLQGPTQAGAPPVALNGILDSAGEMDEFVVDLQQGQSWSVDAFGKRIGSPIDSIVEVIGPDGSLLAMNDDSAMHDSQLVVTAFRSGPHRVRIRDHLGQGGNRFVYRIEMEQPKPSLHFAASTIEAQLPQSPQAITLEPGGKFALLLSATRHNIAGAIQVDATDLPSGVRALCEPVADDSHLCQVVFEADPNASPGASLIGFAGQLSSEGDLCRGELKQKYGLVRGQPRATVYHGFELNKLPLVVCPELPYQINVDQPKASLPTDGQLQLRVQATRKGGFDGPLTLTALKLPRWIERSENPIRINAGESTCLFPLFSSERAEPGTYPIVLLASGRVDGVEVVTSSQRLTITVDDPYAKVTIYSASAKQNEMTQIRCDIEWTRRPEGPVTAQIFGLPKHVQTQEVVVAPDDSAFHFDLNIGSDTPAAIHNTLYVELQIPESGEYRREYHSRGSVLEVLSSDAVPADTRSRLEVLRANRLQRQSK